MVVAAKFKFRAAAGWIQEVQLAVDSRLRLLPMPGDEPPTVEIAAESDQTRVLAFRWPRPLSDQTTLEATFLMSGASGVGKIRLPHVELLDARSSRRWLAVSVDPALASDHQPKESSEAMPAADFLKLWGKADEKPQTVCRLSGDQPQWTLSTRPHEPRITAEQTLSLSFDRDRVDVLFDARLSVASGYVFQYELTAPKGLKLQNVSVLEGDLERAQRWSQGDDGTITVFLNGPASGSERLVMRGQMPIRPGEPWPVPLLGVEKCQIHATTIRLYRRPAVLLAVHGSRRGPGVQLPSQHTPAAELGHLVETIAWDGAVRPTVSVSCETQPVERPSQKGCTSSRRGKVQPGFHHRRGPKSRLRSARRRGARMAKQRKLLWRGRSRHRTGRHRGMSHAVAGGLRTGAGVG